MDRKHLLEKAIKVAKLTRLMAKGIDLFIVACFMLWFFPFGAVLGVIYISFCDGMGNGQSAGKRFLGFAVKSLEDGSPCSYKQSAIRNLPLSLPLLVALLFPVIGWILGAILAIVLIGFELYLLYTLDSGHRLGDVMADTSVMANDDNFEQMKNRKTTWMTSNTTESI